MKKDSKIDESNAIELVNVRKTFYLHHEHINSTKGFFTNLFRKRDNGFDKFDALKDIDLTIKKGEVLGVIGKNGSGKSTLLKIIVGIYASDEGIINTNGRIVPFLELGVGFNMDLTARENIFLNGTILGMTRDEIKECFDKIVDFAEINEFLDVQVKKFSSGMMVRLAFSIAIQAKGDIYILDEVLAVGDAKFQEKSKIEINKLKENNRTVILVSHSMGAILEYCTRVVWIKDGYIYEGETKEKTVEAYLSN